MLGDYSMDYIMESQDEFGYFVENRCPTSSEGRMMLYFYNNAQEFRTLNIEISFYENFYSVDMQSINNVFQNVSVSQGTGAANEIYTTIKGSLDIISTDQCERVYMKLKPINAVINTSPSSEQFIAVTTKMEWADLPGLSEDFTSSIDVSSDLKNFRTLVDEDGDGHVYFSELTSFANDLSKSLYIDEGVTLHADVSQLVDYSNYNMTFGNGAEFQIEDGFINFEEGALIEGCENMWKGIKPVDGILVFRDGEIRDAEIAVNYTQQSAINNFRIELSRTQFINNRIGIYSDLVDENISTFLFGILGNTFKGEGQLKPFSDGSFAGTRPYTGTYYAGFSNVTNSCKSCEFENMSHGIILKSSSGGIGNQKFSNIDLGIYLSPRDNEETGRVVNITRNEFENMGTAILADRHGVSVRENHKIHGANGVRALRMDGKILQVKDNDNIQVTRHGVDLTYGDNAEISNNVITMIGDDPQAVALKYDLMSYHNTFDNTINSGNNDSGILLRNCQQRCRTTENTINSTASNDFAAIKLEGSTGNNVSCNDLFGSGVDASLSQTTASAGIYASMSPVNFIQCNSLREFDQGFLFIGNNDVSDIKGNTLGNHFVGMQLGSDLSTNFQNGLIGTQKHHGNIWDGNYSDLGLRSYAPLSAILLSQFTIDPNDGDDFLPSFNPTGLVLSADSQSFFECTSANSCIGNPGVGIIPDFIPTDKFSPWIGGDGVLQDPNVSVNEGWIWQIDILDAIWTYVDPSTTTPWMDDFVDDMQGTDSEQLLIVMNLIEEANEPNAAIVSINENIVTELTNLDNLQTNGGSQAAIDASIAQLAIYNNSLTTLLAADDSADELLYTQANQILANVITTNDVSAAYKLALGIYIHYLKTNDLTSTQLTQLSTLANNCVTEFGKSVYISRGLLSIKLGYESYDDYTICDYTVPRSSAKESIIDNITIFPNPTTNELMLNSSVSLVSYTIYNINGKLITTDQVSSDRLDVSTLHNGIYLLETVDENGTLHQSKFIKQ